MEGPDRNVALFYSWICSVGRTWRKLLFVFIKKLLATQREHWRKSGVCVCVWLKTHVCVCEWEMGVKFQLQNHLGTSGLTNATDSTPCSCLNNVSLHTYQSPWVDFPTYPPSSRWPVISHHSIHLQREGWWCELKEGGNTRTHSHTGFRCSSTWYQAADNKVRELWAPSPPSCQAASSFCQASSTSKHATNIRDGDLEDLSNWK